MNPGRLDRSAAELDAAIRALIAAPGSSLAEVAAQIGVSRTTLHRRYPTRAHLMDAIARHAISQLHVAQHAAGFRPPDPGEDSTAPSFDAFADSLIRLSSQLQLVLGSGVTEPDIAGAVADLDAPVLEVIRRYQREGTFDAGVPAEWILESLYALSITAGFRVDEGTLARRDAPALVIRTWHDGCRAPSG